MSTHTPGPWHYHIGGTGDYPTWGVRIGRGIVHLPGIEPMEVMDANARLIAAAPELYEALMDLVDGWEAGDTKVESVVKAMEALAKARGEA
jgi:hypothetical protein